MADTPPPSQPTNPHLIDYLADRDEPCPACTYNLRGLKSDRCPECSRELILQIRLAEPRIAAWIAAVIAASAMLGFHGLFLLLGLIMSTTRRGGMETIMWIWMTVCTALGAIVLHVLLRHRRSFGNASGSVRLSLALATWLLAGASALLLPLVLR